MNMSDLEKLRNFVEDARLGLMEKKEIFELRKKRILLKIDSEIGRRKANSKQMYLNRKRKANSVKKNSIKERRRLKKMFPNRIQQRPKPKTELGDCEIEIKKTSSGKKIKFKGKCSKEQLQAFASENGLKEE